MASLFSGLVRPNATVSVYPLVTSQDSAGGNSQARGTALATGVEVLITLATGSRDRRYAGDVNLNGATCTGDNAYLDRQDTVLLIESTNANLPSDLVGRYARVDDETGHSASPDGWIPARYTLKLSQWEPGA